jgi:uncharacterized protein (TIGR02300 family)
MSKSKLGTKFECYNCGTKFYDLGKPNPVCPSCLADQQNPDASIQHDQPRRSKVVEETFVDAEEEIAGAIDIDEEGFVGLEEEEDLDDLEEE